MSPESCSAVRESGPRLAIVSNNSTPVIETYLQQAGLRRMFERVTERYPHMEPEATKPSGHLLVLTMMSMDAAPSATRLVGDSVTDVEAARAAGIRCIGYANEPHEVATLAAVEAPHPAA